MRTEQRDFEIVVARFKENADWTRPYQKHVTIYCKDPQDTNPNYFHLPNVGRESHTYLHHIIENYDDLATMTLFTQGRISDIPHHKVLWNYGIPTPFNQKGLTNRTPHWGKLSLGNYARNMRFTPLTFGQWWDKYLQLPHPNHQNYFVQFMAVFSVHRDVIRAHPKSYYENLISCVSDHVNPEEGHYFERAWYHIFCGVPVVKQSKVNTNTFRSVPKVCRYVMH